MAIKEPSSRRSQILIVFAGIGLALMGNFCWPHNAQRSLERNIVSIIEKDMKRRNDGTSLIGTFVRLAWHCSGTFSAVDKSGGSNGGRIRFAPERNWGANAGLTVAMEALESCWTI